MKLSGLLLVHPGLPFPPSPGSTHKFGCESTHNMLLFDFDCTFHGSEALCDLSTKVRSCTRLTARQNKSSEPNSSVAHNGSLRTDPCRRKELPAATGALPMST